MGYIQIQPNSWVYRWFNRTRGAWGMPDMPITEHPPTEGGQAGEWIPDTPPIPDIPTGGIIPRLGMIKGASFLTNGDYSISYWSRYQKITSSGLWRKVVGATETWIEPIPNTGESSSEWVGLLNNMLPYEGGSSLPEGVWRVKEIFPPFYPTYLGMVEPETGWLSAFSRQTRAHETVEGWQPAYDDILAAKVWHISDYPDTFAVTAYHESWQVSAVVFEAVDYPRPPDEWDLTKFPPFLPLPMTFFPIGLLLGGWGVPESLQTVASVLSVSIGAGRREEKKNERR